MKTIGMTDSGKPFDLGRFENEPEKLMDVALNSMHEIIIDVNDWHFSEIVCNLLENAGYKCTGKGTFAETGARRLYFVIP